MIHIQLDFDRQELARYLDEHLNGPLGLRPSQRVVYDYVIGKVTSEVVELFLLMREVELENLMLKIPSSQLLGLWMKSRLLLLSRQVELHLFFFYWAEHSFLL